MKYVPAEFMHGCTYFEKKHSQPIVKHLYYAVSAVYRADRSKCAFIRCETKYEYGCDNESCEFYEDREPVFG